jgi:beta-lactamase superfamily II metal-dependent hydrolase
MLVLAAGDGDCLWVDFGNPEEPTRVLIDAGTQGTFKALKRALDKVRTDKPSHEVFIVTHVDQDHIGGALALMEDETLAAQFKDVWFNGWDHLVQASGQQSFGAVQGERLTNALKKMPNRWNAAFSRGPVMRKGAATATGVSKLIGAAAVTILSPSPKELAQMREPWADEIRAAGMIKEIKAKRAEERRAGMQAFGVLNVLELADTKVAVDTAPANGSSIATLIDFDKRRLLLGADAHPSVLVDGIRQIQPKGRLVVDVFKAPHHGSAANVTLDLLECIDPKVVVFSSNGSYFRHPDQVAVARVVSHYEGKGVKLVFNYRSKFNEMWASPSLQQRWGFSTQYGIGADGVTVLL